MNIDVIHFSTDMGLHVHKILTVQDLHALLTIFRFFYPAILKSNQGYCIVIPYPFVPLRL